MVPSHEPVNSEFQRMFPSAGLFCLFCLDLSSFASFISSPCFHAFFLIPLITLFLWSPPLFSGLLLLTGCTFKPTFFPILSPMYNNCLGDFCPFYHSSFVSCHGVWTCDCLHEKSQCGLVFQHLEICWQNICEFDSEAGQRLLDFSNLGNLSVSQTCVRWYADGFRGHLLAVCESA